MSKFARMGPVVWLLAGVLAAGCNRETAAPAGGGGASSTSNGQDYLLAVEPADAKGVTAVRKDAADGDEVVVVGRIGGSAQPWVEGRAAFTIVDPALQSCRDTEGDNCPTPWDYCCTPREDLVNAMVTVKFVDARGQTVSVDARQLLGLQELHTVVVRGKAKRDAEGNLTVLASTLFRRPDSPK